MHLFPTQYSMLSTEALQLHLTEAYDLPEMNCRLLVHNVSDTYLLENENEKFIFKLYRDSHRKYGEILGELELLNALKQRNARVSYPIADITGKQIQSFQAAEGIRNGVLFSFAAGKPTHDFYDSRLESIGREMALIHEVTTNIELSNPRRIYDAHTTLLGPIAYIKPEFTELPEEYAWLETITSKTAEKIKQFDLSKFSYGYCHYDFLPHNFHFDEQDEITFFDFDFAGKGLIANDLMTFFVHCFLEVQFKKMTREEADLKFGTFLKAYREIRPVSKEEIEAIPYLGFAFWVFFLEFYQLHFEDWSNTFYTLRFKKERLGWIKNWVEWYCKF
ncbi:MAG TPA: phosphotransferase [Dyadobacter sp.]|jgi:Ser/Thr protein kinase RdoA (MazF antagonist)|nr:phosphotransferase [Dyadobacter sp.]